MQDYRNLEIWRSSRDLTCLVFQVSEHLPDLQTFTQLRNSCVLILSNIIRASGQKDPEHFFEISLESVTLLEHRLVLARNRGWITESEYSVVSRKVSEISRMLKNLMYS